MYKYLVKLFLTYDTFKQCISKSKSYQISLNDEVYLGHDQIYSGIPVLGIIIII